MLGRLRVLAAELLAQDGVVRVAIRQAAPQQLLRAAVRLGHFRSVRFLIDRHIFPEGQDELAGFARKFECKFENLAKRRLGHRSILTCCGPWTSSANTLSLFPEVSIAVPLSPRRSPARCCFGRCANSQNGQAARSALCAYRKFRGGCDVETGGREEHGHSLRPRLRRRTYRCPS